MLTLLSIVVLGVLFAIFATQNTGQITIRFGDFVTPSIPVYLVVLIPLLVGLLLAFFLHVIKDLSQNLTIKEEKEEIKKAKQELAEVTKVSHKLELENAKLKTELGEPEDENAI